MRKIHNIFAIAWGALLAVLVQHFPAENPQFVKFILVLLGFFIALTWYNYWYLRKIEKFNVWVLVRPLLLLAGGLFLFFVIPSAFLRGAFLLLLSFLLAFMELFLGNYAENLLLNEILVLAFGFSLGLMAFQEFFPGRVLWGVVGTFISLFLVSRAFFEFTPKQPQLKNLASAVLAFFCAQVYWAMSFLPFHYSALGFILFNIYYFCMILTYYSFFLTLNAKKIYFHLALMVISTVVVLLATPWKVLK